MGREEPRGSNFTVSARSPLVIEIVAQIEPRPRANDSESDYRTQTSAGVATRAQIPAMPELCTKVRGQGTRRDGARGRWSISVRCAEIQPCDPGTARRHEEEKGASGRNRNQLGAPGTAVRGETVRLLRRDRLRDDWCSERTENEHPTELSHWHFRWGLCEIADVHASARRVACRLRRARTPRQG